MEQQHPGSHYQPLFNLMSKHNLMLLKGEMDDIIDVVRKMEQPVDGPWKYEVHHVQHQEDADEYATISDGKVTLYIDGGQDDGDELRVVNLLNQLKIKLDYDHSAEFVASEYERMLNEANDFIKQIGVLIGAPNPYAYTVDDVKESLRQPADGVKAIHDALTYIYGNLIDPQAVKNNSAYILNLANQALCKYNDEQKQSPASTKDGEIAFAEWAGWDWQRVEGKNLWENQKTLEVMKSEKLYEKYLKATSKENDGG